MDKYSRNSMSVSEFVMSEEFERRVRRVSAKSRPFGNSSTSAEIYALLARIAKEDEQKSKVSNA